MSILLAIKGPFYVFPTSNDMKLNFSCLNIPWIFKSSLLSECNIGLRGWTSGSFYSPEGAFDAKWGGRYVKFVSVCSEVQLHEKFVQI